MDADRGRLEKAPRFWGQYATELVGSFLLRPGGRILASRSRLTVRQAGALDGAGSVLAAKNKPIDGGHPVTKSNVPDAL